MLEGAVPELWWMCDEDENWSSFKGMRYKRRGVDTDGHVANYVETEQLIHVHSHTLSFVQTRGSVPVFWSQAGYRYNPRPRIEKGQRSWVIWAREMFTFRGYENVFRKCDLLLFVFQGRMRRCLTLLLTLRSSLSFTQSRSVWLTTTQRCLRVFCGY